MRENMYAYMCTHVSVTLLACIYWPFTPPSYDHIANQREKPTGFHIKYDLVISMTLSINIDER